MVSRKNYSSAKIADLINMKVRLPVQVPRRTEQSNDREDSEDSEGEKCEEVGNGVALHAMSKSMSKKIMRQNQNLDLGNYNPYLHDFTNYSGDMFDFDTNIFQAQSVDPSEVLKKSLTRTEENEFKLIERSLKSTADEEETKGGGTSKSK